MSLLKTTLRRLLLDPALVTKNAFLDAATLTSLLGHVDSLTPDVTHWLTAAQAATAAGALVADTNTGAIRLATTGSQFATSRFRDGLQTTPRTIRRRRPNQATFVTPADRVRYVLADPTDGVLLLDENMEFVRTFPGLATAAPEAAEYRSAQCAVAFTINDVEYLAIACSQDHVVKIFAYDAGFAPASPVATIGTLSSAGLPTAGSPLLDTPVSLAVDEDGERLFVCCADGLPTGAALLSEGFVAEFDISTVATPTFTKYVAFQRSGKRLNTGGVFRPSDVFFTTALSMGADPLVWVANGLGDVAAFREGPVAWVPSLVLEAQGANYVLGPDLVTVPDEEFATNKIDVFTGEDDITRLYVASSRAGTIETFHLAGDSTSHFGAHVASYGRRGLESSMPYGTPLRAQTSFVQPPLTFGVFASADGVVADDDGATDSFLIVADAVSGRVQRLSLNVFLAENVVTFTAGIAAGNLPVQVVGWFLPPDATLPAEYVTVEVRDPGDATVTPTIAAGPWRQVPPAGFTPPASPLLLTRYQFRVRVTLPGDAPVAAYSTPALGVIMRQQW